MKTAPAWRSMWRGMALMTLIALSAGLSGCFYYHDFDMEQIDRYSYYGHHHCTDVTFFHGDGDDDF